MGQIQREASLEQLDSFQEFISTAAQAFLSPQRILQLQLATEEALVNIFSYAYAGKEVGRVTVTCDGDENGNFRVRFLDRGVAFNMLDAEEPDTRSALEDRPIGGLGIFFIQEMVDQVSYQRIQGQNLLTFIVLPRDGAEA
ncbi:MAG: ATP-binding protein [Desulfobacterales bacterium]|nr:ATP-binding protein [Desulfobacterales bacterium]